VYRLAKERKKTRFHLKKIHLEILFSNLPLLCKIKQIGKIELLTDVVFFSLFCFIFFLMLYVLFKRKRTNSNLLLRVAPDMSKLVSCARM
jgi:hypothetical protein